MELYPLGVAGAYLPVRGGRGVIYLALYALSCFGVEYVGCIPSLIRGSATSLFSGVSLMACVLGVSFGVEL